jgi:hypothetical protein
MNKFRIKGIRSEEYPGGRIDAFDIVLDQDNLFHGNLEPLLIDLKFEGDIGELDTDFSRDWKGTLGARYFLYGNKNIKLHLVVKEAKLEMIFDTSMDRDELLKHIEKYFELPQ